METYQLIKLEEVCTHHKLNDSFIKNIKTFEIVNFIIKDNVHYIAIDDMPVIERVIRLHYDLHINMEGIEVITECAQKSKTYKKPYKVYKID